MHIYVGTKNEAKLDAVRAIIGDYDFLADARVTGVSTESGVPDQPKSLDETVTGAMNRARGAWAAMVPEVGDLALGLESGLMAVPHTRTGHMDVCACAIFDGRDFQLGLSSAWEAPPDLAHLMLNEGLNMTDAFYKLGHTTNPNIGAAEGVIGVLTGGKLDRKKYTMEAIRTALINVEWARKTPPAR